MQFLKKFKIRLHKNTDKKLQKIVKMEYFKCRIFAWAYFMMLSVTMLHAGMCGIEGGEVVATGADIVA